MWEYLINRSLPSGRGFIDRVQFEKCGLVRLAGWVSGRGLEELEPLKFFVGGREAPLFQTFRTCRPDVASALNSEDFYQGFIFEYRVLDAPDDEPKLFRLDLNGATIFETEASFRVERPDHSHLLDAPDVLHREHIYGVGPPSTTVSDDVFQLASSLPGPLLDFGCGSGALVKRLRDHGVEAYGIELERGPIVDSVLPEVREFIHLYGGEFPLPFQTGAFQSAFATEVIEHVADYEQALSEIARVTRRHFTMTVPDIGAIPVCHHNGVVPWHLLESTHVNFFNQTSLERLLRKFFGEVECARICPNTTNDSQWFVNLVGICRK